MRRLHGKDLLGSKATTLHVLEVEKGTWHEGPCGRQAGLLFNHKRKDGQAKLLLNCDKGPGRPVAFLVGPDEWQEKKCPHLVKLGLHLHVTVGQGLGVQARALAKQQHARVVHSCRQRNTKELEDLLRFLPCEDVGELGRLGREVLDQLLEGLRLPWLQILLLLRSRGSCLALLLLLLPLLLLVLLRASLAFSSLARVTLFCCIGVGLLRLLLGCLLLLLLCSHHSLPGRHWAGGVATVLVTS
mmetsp:Transcript_13947/g.55042  ORF Transcript_13947/g.55042 Transcript_13947/m.55042 type:complete len:243 (-) Transcript_13947:249-977(-)